MPEDLLQNHPLADLGQRAARNEDASDPPELGKFNDAIAQYSLNRSAKWEDVLSLATSVAARRLDLKVYGYLALAAFHSERELEDGEPYQCLAAALTALSDVIAHGWERCQPRIPTRRQALLKWLSEELADPVKLRPPKPREVQSFLVCQRVTDELGTAAGTAMSFDYPLLRELREAIGSHRVGVDEVLAKQQALNAPKATAQAAQAEKAAQAAAKASSEPTPPPPSTEIHATPIVAGSPSQATPTVAAPSAPLPKLDDMDRDALADHLASATSRLTAAIRAEAITDPTAYWLSRALRWANHDLLRPDRTAEIAANKYKTALPVPQGYRNLCKQLPTRLAQGQHVAVLTDCEDLFATYPLWLDLQRWAAQALDMLGSDGAAARTVLTHQVILLLKRCPEVARFHFSDREGTPVADAETQTWLESERNRASGANSNSEGAADSAEPLPEGLAPGVQHMQRQIAQARSGCQRFEARLRLAELLLRHQRSDIAMPVLAELLATAEAHRLSDWQPELLARMLRVSVEAARAAELDKGPRSLLWAKLCNINPGEALLLGPEPA